MKLIQFTAGTAGVPVWINADAVSAVQSDADSDGRLTLITTQDGKAHLVQEALATVVAKLQADG
jgi:uncharacterized protein YlzI (FlbEa/FlbD family)